MSQQWITDKELEKMTWLIVINFLVPKFKSLGMEASQNWEKNIGVRTEAPFKSTITGTDYTEQLVFGRKPGTMPPVEKLVQWAQIKLGLGAAEAQSAGWAIAKNIQARGTRYYQRGGTDLLEVLESEECLDYCRKYLTDAIIPKISDALVRNAKELLEDKK